MKFTINKKTSVHLKPPWRNKKTNHCLVQGSTVYLTISSNKNIYFKFLWKITLKMLNTWIDNWDIEKHIWLIKDEKM